MSALNEHLKYVADRTRRERFSAAIRKVIKPGDVVADIGCGSGILSLLCLQAGAGQVYAIENTSMIEVARETLKRANFGDHSVFIRENSYRVCLPEPVDLVICDHVGYFGFDYGIIRTLQDSRRRFLKHGGALIPSRLRLQLGAVESEKYRERAEGWRSDLVPPEFHWLRHHGVNTKHAAFIACKELLCPLTELAEIDLLEDNSDFFSWTAELHITRDGVMHGLVGCFDCELAEGVRMTNSPLSERAIHRPQAFLPVDESINVKMGDCIIVKIMARPADNVITWVVEFPASDHRLSHSTWKGTVLSPEDLIRAKPTRFPKLSRQGRERLTVLRYCDGRRTAQEIEEAVKRDHPNLFPCPEEISRFVAHVLDTDTE